MAKSSLALVAYVFAALIGSSLAIFKSPAQTRPPAGVRTPFTAVSQLLSFKDGKQIDWKNDTDSFFSDGSSIHVANSYNGKPVGWKTIINIGSRTRVTVDPATSSLTTYRISDNELVHATQRISCDGPAAGKLLGYDVVKISKTTGQGPYKNVTESLVAPLLDCYPLFSGANLVDATGAVLERQETSVTAVLAGEISRSELVLPTGYVERSPSEVRTLHAQMQGRTCTDCEVKGNSVLDQVYKKANQ